MKNFIKIASAVVVVAVIMWGLVWLGKWGSYVFFYEAQVKQTIYELVDPEFLR